jgi:hypothetical protein
VGEEDFASMHASVNPQSQTIFDAKPHPELLDKYTDEDFDNILFEYEKEHIKELEESKVP